MNKINKKQLIIVGIIAIVVAYFSLSSKDEPKQDEALANFYKKDEVSAKKLFVSIEASGLIEAISSVEIKSKASGEILFLGAEVGDFISKGSMLSQIDQRTPKNILDQSKSDLTASNVRLKNAEAQFNRGKELHEKGSISDKDFEDIQENFAQAKSTLVRTQVTYENAKIALDDTVVRSPVSGTVISRPVEVGQVISSPTQAVGGGTVLMTMADLSKVRVRALVDEIDVGKVSIGQKVSIKVAAYRDKEFFGTVSKIEPKARVEQNVTTFPVLIDIDNKENLLLLGMNTDVVIDVLNTFSEQKFERRGDDIYCLDKKLNVSIATVSPVSTLIHFGVNVDASGAPVAAIGLKDLGIDAEKFAKQVLGLVCKEVENIYEASVKVFTV